MYKKYNVLIDITLCTQPYCGIQYDLCHIFNVLNQLNTVNLSGLALTSQPLPFSFNPRKTKNKLEWVNKQSRYWDMCLNKEQVQSKSFKTYYGFALNSIVRLFSNQSTLHKSDSTFHHLIWEHFFSKTIPVKYHDLITPENFHMTNLSKYLIIAATKLGISMKIETSNWDFALIQDQFPIKVSPNTIKLVRHHDTIPITRPDKVSTVFSTHYKRALSLAKKNAFFVCNSDPSRENLVSIIPELEDKSCTIPCVISPISSQLVPKTSLNKILSNYISFSLVGKVVNSIEIQQQLLKQTDPINYILITGALEPKKNLVTLIRAWEYLKYQYDTRIKLVVVANKGWEYKAIIKAMSNHIARGDLIHLENVTNEVMAMLYSNALAFVFPSYVEGFGIPPLQAMQHACPTIVSDIKTHHWVLGDASLYCNPYDVISLKDKLVALLYSDQSTELRKTLIEKGLKRTQRYSVQEISELWQSLFRRLKPELK